jgi:hypothetical protein
MIGWMVQPMLTRSTRTALRRWRRLVLRVALARAWRTQDGLGF